MVIRINKSDFERIIKALEIARHLETNDNKRDKYNLTKKKLKRLTK